MSLVGPKTYEAEPERHPDLQINSAQPFNAEPRPPSLVDKYITPEHFFYKRNHGPIPVLDDPQSWELQVRGLLPRELRLSLQDLAELPKHTVVVTLQCAGNRRTEMSEVRKVKGVGWGMAALGTAEWGGARLSDVLAMTGIAPSSQTTRQGGRHVEFVSVDACKEEDGGAYRSSIPLLQATSPDADVLLAYEMNGAVLSRDHGFPLRVVVPGVIGARSVKWLKSVEVTERECQGFFMQRDYKMFPPSVDWGNVDWTTRRPIMDFPVQCAICVPPDGTAIEQGSSMRIAGYAVSGGGRGIERVDVSVDGGSNWLEATRLPQDRPHPYVVDDPDQDKWAWVLWEIFVPINAPTEIVAKAVDSAANVQPSDVGSIWNLRGVLNNSWHRIRVGVIPRTSTSLL